MEPTNLLFCVFLLTISIIYYCKKRRAANSIRRRREHLQNFSGQERRERAVADLSERTTGPLVEEGTEEEQRDTKINDCIFVKTFEEGNDPCDIISTIKNATSSSNDSSSTRVAQTWFSAKSEFFNSDRSSKSTGSQPECSICLDIYEVGDNLACAKTNKCNHVFHEDCIKLWLKERNECPLCRANMLESSEIEA